MPRQSALFTTNTFAPAGAGISMSVIESRPVCASFTEPSNYRYIGHKNLRVNKALPSHLASDFTFRRSALSPGFMAAVRAFMAGIVSLMAISVVLYALPTIF